MIKHIPAVGALLLVQGAFECMLGLLFALVGPVTLAMLFVDPGSGSRDTPPPPAETMLGIGVGYTIVGAVVVLVAILKIIAAIQVLRYRSRILGLIAAATGLVGVLTCYCAPTGIALAIYGAIVLLSPVAVEAFKMGDQGHRGHEIRARFAAR